MSTNTEHGVRVHFAFNHPGFALKVDLDLAGTGVTALFGPSGSGKTSCLRVIAGLTRSDPDYQAFIAVKGEVWQDDAQGVFVPVHRRAIEQECPANRAGHSEFSHPGEARDLPS